MSPLAHAAAILIVFAIGALIGRLTKPTRVITDAGDTHADIGQMLTADSALIDRQCKALQRQAAAVRKVRAGAPGALKPSYDGRKAATPVRAGLPH